MQFQPLYGSSVIVSAEQQRQCAPDLPATLEYAAAVPLEKGQMLQRRGELGQVEVVEPQRLFHLSIVLLRGATYTYTPHHSSGKR